MYSAFRKVMPKLCSFSTPAPRTAAASTAPNSSRIRFQMVACAFVEICWPTMWCTTAEKRSVSTSLSMCPACAMTAAIRSSLALRYAVSASPYWKYIRVLLHVTTFCLNTGCCVDYSKKYVYLQYKKTPAAQHYTVQRASYLSAERNGMWYKYRKISQKRHVFKIRIRRECSSPHEKPEIKRRAWRCYAFRPAS